MTSRARAYCGERRSKLGSHRASRSGNSASQVSLVSIADQGMTSRARAYCGGTAFETRHHKFLVSIADQGLRPAMSLA